MAASVEIIASVGINCPLLFQLAYSIEAHGAACIRADDRCETVKTLLQGARRGDLPRLIILEFVVNGRLARKTRSLLE